jgi:cardiolipin synthase A/B
VEAASSGTHDDIAPHVDERRDMRVVAALVVAVIAVVGYLARRVFGIVSEESWPPSADALTAADVEAAVARFDGGPTDVGLPYAWSTAATVEPWPEGREFFPRIFEDVRNAQSSVHVLMFGWREGEIGTAFADLLVEKLAAGVEVRAIVDGQGSRANGPARAMFDRLRAAGAQIAVNDLRRYADGLGRVDHRKLYVVDGLVAWIGGAGLEDHFENGGFHDVMVRVTGDVVRQAQALFLMSFKGHGLAMPGELSPYFPAQPEPGTLPTALLQVVPTGFQSATQAIRQLIDEATTRLDVMNPYATDRDVLARLEAAARRGVRVRIVVSERSNNGQATAAFKHHYASLLDAGVEIYEFPGAVVHAKVIVADDAVLFGTVNLDAWALYRNYEVALLVHDAATAQLFEERLFEPDIACCARGVHDGALGARLRSRVADRLSYFI